MTTIATDGVTIAADSLLTFDHERSYHPSRKVMVEQGAIYAVAGVGGMLEVLAKWVQDGHNPYSAPNVHSDEQWSMLVIDAQGMRYFHSRALYPIAVTPPFAMGKGGEFATGAIEAGATPERAVEIACRRSITSGLPIQVVDIKEALGIREPGLRVAKG